MKIRIKVEGKTDISTIQDLFESLGVTSINVTKSERLREIREMNDIMDHIRKEVEETISRRVVIRELIIKKDSTYLLSGEVEQDS